VSGRILRADASWAGQSAPVHERFVVQKTVMGEPLRTLTHFFFSLFVGIKVAAAGLIISTTMYYRNEISY